MYLMAFNRVGIQGTREYLHRKCNGGLPFVSKQINSSEGLCHAAHATSSGSAYI